MQVKERAISTERARQMFTMFGAKMWPKSEAGWARYDRDRDQAVKEIMDARRQRGFGLFNLKDYLARPKDGKQPLEETPPAGPVSLGEEPDNRKLDPETSAQGNSIPLLRRRALLFYRERYPGRPRGDSNLVCRATAIR